MALPCHPCYPARLAAPVRNETEIVMSETTTATPLRTRLEGGSTPRLDHWGATCEYGLLRDVLVGSADAFRWLGEENAQYSALVRETLRLARRPPPFRQKGQP